MVIGEDLGTVADFIRESLKKFGVLSYRLFFFEKHRDGSMKLPAEYPIRALVSASTHDLPTLAGFWTGHDIEVRRRLGLIPGDKSYREQREGRAAERQLMLDALHQLGLVPDWFPRSASDVPELTGELHNAIVGFLASTGAQLLSINQEDVFKQPQQQNLPGTTAEYPNWRNKMRFSIEELQSVPYARDCAAMLRGWLVRTNRAI
jgi:4-alpha-glucanotransferase